MSLIVAEAIFGEAPPPFGGGRLNDVLKDLQFILSRLANGFL